MKKKLIALVLTLVLACVMMLPGFAAVAPAENTQSTCNHVWVMSDRIIDSYQMVNASYHWVFYHYDRICSLCARYEAAYTSGRYDEGHNPPCYKCHCGVPA